MDNDKIITLILTEEQMNVLENIAYLEPWIMDNIESATYQHEGYRIEFDDFEIIDVLGALEYEAKCSAVKNEKEDIYRLYQEVKIYLSLLEQIP